MEKTIETSEIDNNVIWEQGKSWKEQGFFLRLRNMQSIDIVSSTMPDTANNRNDFLYVAFV